jgi:streptogramin lyase
MKFCINPNGLAFVPLLLGRKSARLIMPARLLAAVGLLLLLPASWADAPAPALWAAIDHHLERIDPGTRQVTTSLAFNPEVQALVLDPRDGSLWVLAEQQLVKYDAAGNLQQTFDLTTLASGLGEPKALALDPYDGSLWVGGEKTLLHLTPAGQTLAIWAAPDHFQALARGMVPKVSSPPSRWNRCRRVCG